MEKINLETAGSKEKPLSAEEETRQQAEVDSLVSEIINIRASDEFPNIPLELSSKIADKLIEKGEGRFVAANLEKFTGLDHPAIADKLIEKGKGWFMAANLEKFTGLDHLAIADRLIEKGEGGSVAANLEKFTGLDHLAIADRLIEEGKGGSVAANLEKFTGLDHPAIADKLIEEGKGGSVTAYLDKFTGLTLAIADKLIEKGEGGSVAAHLEKFTGLDHPAIADKLIEKGEGRFVAAYLDKFTGLTLAIADKLIEKGEGWFMAAHLEKFTDLDHPAIADKLIEKGEGGSVAAHLEKFTGLTKDRLLGQRLLNALTSTNDIPFEYLIKVNNAYTPPLDAALAKTSEVFGDFATIENYRLIQELVSGNIPSEAKELGIQASGEKGIAQLARQLESFQLEMLKDDFNPDVLLTSPALLSFFKQCVSFDGSQWGNHEENNLMETIKTFIRLQKSNKLVPLQSAYLSEKTNIARVDEDAQKNFKYSESFLNRYGLLLNAVQLAEQAVLHKDSKLFSKLTAAIDVKLQSLIDGLAAKSAAMLNPKAKEAIVKKIANLKSLNLRSIKSFQKNFATLSDFKELHADLRQVLFSYALRKNPNWQKEQFGGYDSQQPTVDQITKVLDFIDHIVNQETFNQYFTDQHAAKKFRELINIRAIEEELSRAQNQAVTKTIPFEFIPTRGLLTEFSGYIADACWASVYESILKL